MSISATATTTVKGIRSVGLDLGSVRELLQFSVNLSFTSGAGVNQVDEQWSDTRTLTAGGSDNIDLAGGIQNALGQTINFARVKILGIYNKSSTQVLTVGGATSNAWVNWVGDATDTVKIRPGGCLLLIAPDSTGYQVVAGTGDVLKITNSAGSSCEYDIIVLGATS